MLLARLAGIQVRLEPPPSDIQDDTAIIQGVIALLNYLGNGLGQRQYADTEGSLTHNHNILHARRLQHCSAAPPRGHKMPDTEFQN